MKKYRIAIFHNLISGGAKRSIYEYAKSLSHRGHQIDLFTLNSREDEFLSISEYVENKFVHDFSPILSLGDHTFLFSPLRLLEIKRLRKVSKKIATRIENGNYDVAFVHNSRYIQCPMVMRYIHKIPKIYYCHETFRFLTEAHPHLGTKRDAMRNLLLSLFRSYLKPISHLEKENIKQADMVLTNSYFTKENLSHSYALNAEVCYQGVDVKRFRPIHIDRENMVLCVGQLTRWKAQDFLVDSLSLLPTEIRPILVLVYDKGNVSYRKYLEKLAADRRVDLLFKKGITDDELIELYNRSRAFVYAPIREPFGFVPLEAMACGTPVIAVLEGGVKEVLKEESGGIGVKRNPVEFANTLKDLLSSDNLWQEVGDKGRKYVLSQWTWEKAAERLETKIESLVLNA